MNALPDDPKRSGVKATLIAWTEPPLFLDHDRWHGPHGAFIEQTDLSGSNWTLCCPGCGEVGTPKAGAHWRATAGSFDDVSTLTLEPSIQKSCCGWHGYLKNGVFVSC